jgi:glycosyltransferase involved in cell wall biosynthesis
MPHLKIALIADAGSINIHRWIEALYKNDLEIHVLSFRRGDVSPASLQVLDIPNLPLQLHYFAAVPKAIKFVNKIEPDIVIGYYATGYGLLATLSNCHHPLIIVTSGDDLLVTPYHSLSKRILVKFVLSRANLVLAWAPHMGAAAIKLGASPAKVKVLPRGIPVELFARAHEAPRQAKDKLRLISTRSLLPYYRIDKLLIAFKLLSNLIPGVTLTIVGDGCARNYLERLSKELQVSNRVTFLGEVNNNLLPDILGKHDIYISLSPSDGVSASLLEAMATGIYPIVMDHPANCYWITNNLNGYLLSDVRPDHIVEAIMDSWQDINLRQVASTHNMRLSKEKGDMNINGRIFYEWFQSIL